MVPVESKLRAAGLDPEFLAWLEGKDDRVPRLELIQKISPKTFASAILAVAWIGGHIGVPGAMQDQDIRTFSSRYRLLELFLIAATKQNMAARRQMRQSDLTRLGEIIDVLLPESTAREYKEEIIVFAEEAQPAHALRAGARRRGGPPESEETRRMRAAVEYLKQVSDQPYRDLADFWNDRHGTEYDADSISARLRKGSTKEGAVSLAYWLGVYNCEFSRVFPGPFPLSPKLQARCRDAEQYQEVEEMIQFIAGEAPEYEAQLRGIVASLLRKGPRV